MKAIIWNIWLAKNDCIFNAKALFAHYIILKVDRMIISWCSSIAKGPRAKLEDSITTVRSILEFLSPRVQEFGGTLPTKEVDEYNTG